MVTGLRVKEPRETLVLVKGIYNSTTIKSVIRERSWNAATRCHPKEGDARYSRLRTQARWILSRRNPLTARVIVKPGTWQTLSSDAAFRKTDPFDFGLQGAKSRPPVPGLTSDWLGRLRVCWSPDGGPFQRHFAFACDSFTE